MTLVGYHGTKRENEEPITEVGLKLPDHKKLSGDLGRGIYFYVDNDFFVKKPKDLCFEYLQFLLGKNFKRDDIIIYKAEFDEKKFNFFDLNSEDLLKEINEYRMENLHLISEIFEKYLEANMRKNRKKKNSKLITGAVYRGNLDGILIEMFIKEFEKINGVPINGVLKNTFTPCLRGYKRSSFFNGTELCVFNEELIPDLERVI